MTSKDLGKRFDARLGKGSEGFTRRISRRDAARTAILSAVATAGALALGQRPAFATVTCPDRCGPSPRCSSGCPSPTGCPPGRSLCKAPTCGCEWTNGSWVHCQGYGTCGHGFTLCQDCHNSSCNICICISGILCGNCCSPADILAEQERLQKLAAAAP